MKHKFSVVGWICFLALLLTGAALWLFAPSYGFSGIFLAALSLVFPIHMLIGRISGVTCRRVFRIAEALCLGTLAVAMGITCGLIVHSSFGSPAPQADYLIVLGAGVNGTAPSPSLQERIDAAADYLNDHPHAIAVVSGGQGGGEDISEALCMYQTLTSMGIPAQRIWMEDRATSTLENLQFSLALIQEKTGAAPDRVAIVSSEYHLHRAALLARRLELTDCELVPAKTASVSLRINYCLREIFAVWYYTLLGGA